MKRKLDQLSKEVEANAEKRRHKSLKDQPRPISTPALRKRKELEMTDRNNELKSPPTQLHPSIIAQPSINKEKRIERELRDKEREGEVQEMDSQPSITI